MIIFPVRNLSTALFLCCILHSKELQFLPDTIDFKFIIIFG